jgi:hypothetical protein
MVKPKEKNIAVVRLNSGRDIIDQPWMQEDGRVEAASLVIYPCFCFCSMAHHYLRPSPWINWWETSSLAWNNSYLSLIGGLTSSHVHGDHENQTRTSWSFPSLPRATMPAPLPSPASLPVSSWTPPSRIHSRQRHRPTLLLVGRGADHLYWIYVIFIL